MILINPHSSDRIFKPLFFWVFKLKSSNKYGYLNESFRGKDSFINFFFTYDKSSFPLEKFKIFNYKFLKKAFIKLEIFVWLRINNIRDYQILKSLEGVVFLFIDKNLSQLKNLEKNVKVSKIFLHISHYHNIEKLNTLEFEKLYLCYDFNVAKVAYFQQKFLHYNRQILIVPYFVKNIFFTHEFNEYRKTNVSIIGSYHVFNPKIRDIGIYDFSNNISTLHPLRYELSKINFNSKIRNLLSKVNQKSFFKSLFRNYKYYNFSIVDFYSQTKYVVCPSEGTGALGISVLESMAMGCGVIISNEDYFMLGCPKIQGIEIFDDFENLVDIINDLSENPKAIDQEGLRKFSIYYSRDSLVETVKTQLSISP